MSIGEASPLPLPLDRSVLVCVSAMDSARKRSKRLPYHVYDHGVTSYSASGWLACPRHGYVLTSGWPLSVFMAASGAASPALVSSARIAVLPQRERDAPLYADPAEWLDAGLVRCEVVPTLAAAMTALTGLAGEWYAGWRPASSASSPTAQPDARLRHPAGCAMMALLACPGLARGCEHTCSCDWLGPWADARERAVARGTSLTLLGSPYGMLSIPAFHNCVLHGHVSNAIRDPRATPAASNGDAHLLLIDAPCFPGMEGGPVFARTPHGGPRHGFAGMLLPPMQRKDGYTVDLHLVAPAAAVGDFWRRTRTLRLQRNKAEPASAHGGQQAGMATSSVGAHHLASPAPHGCAVDRLPWLRPATMAVVLLSMGSSWASGVICSPEGHVLTSAHLIQSYVAPDNLQRASEPGVSSALVRPPPRGLNPKLKAGYAVDGVRVRLTRNPPHASAPAYEWVGGDVLFVSKGHVDLAVIRAKVPKHAEANVAEASAWTRRALSCVQSKEPTAGDPVYAYGFPLFGVQAQLPPTLTRGSIVKVVRHHGEPAIIESSAAVHEGNSGGALVAQGGHFVGLVTANVTNVDGHVVPRFNMSISVAQLAPAMQWCNTQASDAACWDPLYAYDDLDTDLASVWKLSVDLEPPPQQGDAAQRLQRYVETNLQSKL